MDRFQTSYFLRGSHGFAQEYVQLARDLSRVGFLSMAACWFREGGGAGARFITPILWPGAPPAADPLSEQSVRTVGALVHAMRGLPDARTDRLGLFGHSRGGGAALNYMLRVGDVQAGVLSSSRYPRQLADIASRMKVPLLMLHGTADDPAEGGTEFTDVRMARNFEHALCAAEKPVEAVYYEGGRHNDIFANSSRYHDELKRMAGFYRQHLTGDA